jgi:hypothetical protein
MRPENQNSPNSARTDFVNGLLGGGNTFQPGFAINPPSPLPTVGDFVTQAQLSGSFVGETPALFSDTFSTDYVISQLLTDTTVAGGSTDPTFGVVPPDPDPPTPDVPVPEPLGMMLLGVAAFGYMRRRANR